MKKILMIILMATMVTPSFAFAKNDNSQGSNRENGSGRINSILHRASSDKKVSSQQDGSQKFNQFGQYSTSTFQFASTSPMLKHIENSTSTSAIGEKIKKIKAFDNDKDDRHYSATTTPDQIGVKTNYFLCKTSSGWDVIPVVANGSNNSANSQGVFCMKLPFGFAKYFVHQTATSTPDVTAPLIASLGSSLVSTTTATISWSTNENANGNVYIGITSPVSATGTPVGIATALTTSHSFGLTGLTASTTYYYVVTSTDVSGNLATSGQQSFTTPAVSVADTTAPVISNVATSAIGTTTATVSWSTNELTTGKLFFGTSQPITTFINDATSSLSHSVTLSGLTASTTYNYFIQAIDSSSNSATSTIGTITTTP